MLAYDRRMSFDDLSDFERLDLTYRGKTKAVYRKGAGPAVVVISEIPGITPQVADFARKVVDIGCTVAMPSLFGSSGRPITTGYALKSISRTCVSREFYLLAKNKRSRVTDWLIDLSRDLHEECGGPGVGAIGMCLTGGFALAMMVDPVVVAPVLSQPSLPLPFGSKRKAAVGLSPDELRVVVARATDGCSVLGLRFTADAMSPADRFETLRRELGDGFVAVEIDSGAGNENGLTKSAHSCVTNDLKPDPDHPTQHALDQVLDFFRDRLLVDHR